MPRTRAETWVPSDPLVLRRLIQVALLDYVAFPDNIDAAERAAHVAVTYILGDRIGDPERPLSSLPPEKPR